jgi:hypothetical protein
VQATISLTSKPLSLVTNSFFGATNAAAEARGLGLEHLAELELQVVHETHAGGRRRFAREVMEKGEAVLERRKEQRVVFLHLGQRKIFTTACVMMPSMPSRAEHPATRIDAADSRGAGESPA